MLISYANGQTGVILRVKLRQDTTGAKPGNGFTGASNTSTGLVIGTITDVEASSTAYTSAGSTIQTIATLGTFAAPTSGDCRFAQVDATNHPGIVEIQIANARFAVSGAKSLLVSISGVTGMSDCDACVPLTGVNPYDAVHGGMSALPNTAVTVNASLLTSGTGTDQLSVSSGKTLLQATQSGVTIPTVTTVTNQLSAAAIATGVWEDTTAGGDFGTTGSIGKLIVTTGLTVSAVTGAVGSVTGAVGSVTGAVGSVTANVTFGNTSIATVTNLTNAPTAGDLTATMKTSIGTAVAASAVASVTGSVGGSVGSVTAGVTVSTNNDKTGYSLTQAFPANFSALGISAGGKVSEVTLVDTLTAYTGNTVQTGDSYARIGAAGSGLSSLAPAATALSTATWTGTLASYLTSLGATFASTGVFSTAALANAPGGGSVSLSSSGLDAIVVESGMNARQALAVIAASAAGVLAGAATSTITIDGAGVATTRITATVDTNGDRSAVTLALPS